MIIGFTGSQRGTTSAQLAAFEALIRSWTPLQHSSPGVSAQPARVLEFHHGDCVEWDAAAHAIVRRVTPQGTGGWWIVGHIPNDDRKRAFCDFDEQRAPAPYLVRNRMIVIAASTMIACPAQHVEQRRSGTWSTIRYARSCGKPLAIVWPDGEYTTENW